MTAHMLGWVVLGSMLLICLGLLLGTSWTTQVLQSKLRHQAQERRWLNEQWSAVRRAHRERTVCVRCGGRLPSQH